MAHIVVIVHLHDEFQGEDYLLHHLIDHWMRGGHRITVARGLSEWPAADIAILHVDLTVVPQAYAQAAKKYPVVVNGAALDIRKRHVSRNILRPGADWHGPVILKTDLNCRGVREARLLKIVEGQGAVADESLAGTVWLQGQYPILESPHAVRSETWNNPGVVVEKFLPERDERGYWTRVWAFFGDRERCTRYLAHGPIVKSKSMIAAEPASVPPELRRERERLGFDYGKFDFVIHGGEPVLLDANRTPWAPPRNAVNDASNANLARGLDALLRQA